MWTDTVWCSVLCLQILAGLGCALSSDRLKTTAPEDTSSPIHLARGHLTMQLGVPGIWTSALLITRQPALPPELQPYCIPKRIWPLKKKRNFQEMRKEMWCHHVSTTRSSSGLQTINTMWPHIYSGMYIYVYIWCRRVSPFIKAQVHWKCPTQLFLSMAELANERCEMPTATFRTSSDLF